MGKGKILCVSVLSLALLCSCQGNTEEPKSEGSKVMDAVNKTVNKKSFVSAAIWDENTRRLDIEIADTEDSSKVKKEINNRLENQGVKPYTINIKERDMKIVEKEKRWNKVTGSILENIFTKNEYKGSEIHQMNIEEKQPNVLIINTKISSANPDAKEFGKKLEKEITDLFKTEEVSKWIGSDSYTIEIYSKDKQKINL
ncbi:DUF4030 domain-containing protein [Bacillus cereus]|uniref:DUF4030 domain-containing protein n=1 Tax=Bacillus cereus TaxID=1396 RepID=UPI000BED2ECE|nr:DUF4030 domain-containing protein [Bacillus cereus]PEC76870.1 hypothetical protein CON08_25570 [Bacillus cereus]PEE56606.1 hypothetical protein COM68_23675 [Bacillus cereus]PET23393.1 hypothetical protein CN519_26865 [Bacillus cereus]PEZ31901.1 hypothetical protein CN361_23540 [Bacillus cereus]PEZ49589.1 hypothetical protein CN363_23810 [Bacillus cereus]